MELTTTNLIKILIAVFVIIAIIIGVYLSMKTYIIPYFKGAGPSGEEDKGVVSGSVSICDGKTISVGYINDKKYFVKDGETKPTRIYFKKGKIYYDRPWNPINNHIGRINQNAEIEIFIAKKDVKGVKNYYNDLNKALVGGNQVCK
tara:strand:- start:3478 stop:3915 length:438 start_codon:yes stop_codon:yes gene_type:complete